MKEIKIMKKIRNWINNYGGWVFLAAIILIPLGSFVSCADAQAKEVRQEMGVDIMPNGNRIYEIQRDGATYIVVQFHNGIGICPKAGEIVWTKEVK